VPINFEHVHVACLCGANGSGKSSIFDAITWALWGKASRGDNDDLLLSGSNEMSVALDFVAGGQRFRIIRKYARPSPSRSGQSMVDLQVWHDGLYRQISDHAKRETQEKINSLLRLEYTTFINSAMLLQGRSNEFSKKRPGERKEILAGILDLSFYDQLEQQCRSRADTNKNESATLQREIAAMNERLGEKAASESALTHSEESLRKIILQKEPIEQAAAVLRQQKDSLIARKDHLRLVKDQIDHRSQNLLLKKQRLDATTTSIARTRKILEKRDDIEHGFERFQQASALDEEMTGKLKISRELEMRKARLEALVNAAQSAYSNELKLLASRIKDMDAKHIRLPQLQEMRAALMQEQENLVVDESDLENEREHALQMLSDINFLKASSTEAAAGIRDLRGKLDLLSHAGASCPLCQSELSPERCAKLADKLSCELEQRIALDEEATNKISILEADSISLSIEIARAEANCKSARQRITQQLAVADKDLVEASSLAAELARQRKSAQELGSLLSSKGYAEAEQREIKSINEDLEKLCYDAALHCKINREKADLQKFSKLYDEAAEAQLKLDYNIAAEKELTADIQVLEQELIELNSQSRILEDELAALPQVISQLAMHESQLRELSANEIKARSEISKLMEKLRLLDEMFKAMKSLENSLLKHQEEEGIYSELCRYFSKKGIQALIIEETLPEIEDEANRLLAKMTDNRMSLALESQRDTKKGSTIETLDIKIADELGTRSYEMFSGGEAYRIDLALRIAISRLLVRRAGAAMPILIIDEGFGTQDNAGMGKMVESINSIQDDFEKIFVITHLDELKERFPVLINIEKGPDGSTVIFNQ
jgi:exonuclease SbcC